MRRIFALAVLVAGAACSGPALAEGASVNPNTVRQCYAMSPRGQTAPKCIGAAANACQALPGGSTTLGIVDCLGAETAVWDNLLNEGYRKVRTEFRNEGGGLPEALLKAQRAWIGYRDAECALEYTRWGNGSMRSVAAATCLMNMTAARAIGLRDMGAGR